MTTANILRARRPNWLGLWTLYAREVMRFAKIYQQTIIAPGITALMFLAVFSLAFGGGAGRSVPGVPFTQFLVPGLAMMAILTSAFINTSTSMLVAKVAGNIVDTLMPPLSAGEIVAGYVLAAATRGVTAATAVVVAMSVFVPVAAHAPLLILFYGAGAAVLLALCGLLTAIWAERFDQIGFVASFVVIPLSFLSGTFYSIKALPEGFQAFSRFNPFFYAIDGFRYGFIGHADAPIATGIVVVLGLIAVLWTAAVALLRAGYKLRA